MILCKTGRLCRKEWKGTTPKCRQFDESFITYYTRSCHFEKFKWSQWENFVKITTLMIFATVSSCWDLGIRYKVYTLRLIKTVVWVCLREVGRSTIQSLRARFMGPTWGPSGADRVHFFTMITTGVVDCIVNTILWHDDVIKWKHFPCCWPFVIGIHLSPVDYPHKGQWHGALMFSLISAWTNGWANNRDTDDLRRHRAHDDVTVMEKLVVLLSWCPVMWSCFCGPFEVPVDLIHMCQSSNE